MCFQFESTGKQNLRDWCQKVFSSSLLNKYFLNPRSLIYLEDNCRLDRSWSIRQRRLIFLWAISFRFSNVSFRMTFIIVKVEVCTAWSNPPVNLQFLSKMNLWTGSRTKEMFAKVLFSRIAKVKMDLTVNSFLGSYFNFGQFESFNPRLSSKRKSSLIVARRSPFSSTRSSWWS